MSCADYVPYGRAARNRLFQQRFHLLLTDSPRWVVDDSQQRDLVARRLDHPQVSEDILDFLAVEKRLAAQNDIGNFRFAQLRLERTRLLIRAKENGKIPRLQSIGLDTPANIGHRFAGL